MNKGIIIKKIYINIVWNIVLCCELKLKKKLNFV